jgi:hypothetical protein
MHDVLADPFSERSLRMREMTERLFKLMDEEHQKSAFVQQSGFQVCRKCQAKWPCDMRLVLDSHKQLGALFNTVGNLNMLAYGLVSELTDELEAYPDHLEKLTDDTLVTRAREYLAIGMPS